MFSGYCSTVAQQIIKDKGNKVRKTKEKEVKMRLDSK